MAAVVYKGLLNVVLKTKFESFAANPVFFPKVYLAVCSQCYYEQLAVSFHAERTPFVAH